MALGLFVAIATFTGIYTFLRGLQEPVVDEETGKPVPTAEVRPGEPVNVLFLGVDASRDLGLPVDRRRTDTVMVASFDPESRRVGILSIPRDTRVFIEGHGYEKVAHAHAYGGPALAMKAVGEFLDLPIHYYVRTDFEGFKNIIDILGGVEIDIEEPMHYEDKAADLYIHFEPGHYMLDGEQALLYVRYRGYRNGDIGRVEHQQKFLQALMDEVFQASTILKLPAIAGQLARYVDTNMSAGEMVRYARLGMSVSRENIAMAMVPGEAKWIKEDTGYVSYWIPDESALRRLVDEVLWGIDFERNASIRVEVLNGSDTPGLASKMADALMRQGYNVVNIGTVTGEGYATTQVINRNGEEDKAKRVAQSVARLLGDATEVYDEVVEGSSVDVTVIVGNDYSAE